MKIKTTFRLFIILSLVLPLAGFAWTELIATDQTQEIQDLLLWDGYGGLLWQGTEEQEMTTLALIFLLLFIGLGILGVASIVGMFLFKKWARTITVVITIFSIMSTPFMGIWIGMPIDTMFGDISAYLFGALLCMSYLEPLNSEFNNA